jgi:hypothetical protein
MKNWSWCQSVPGLGYGSDTTSAILNLRRLRPGTRFDCSVSGSCWEYFGCWNGHRLQVKWDRIIFVWPFTIGVRLSDVHSRPTCAASDDAYGNWGGKREPHFVASCAL